MVVGLAVLAYTIFVGISGRKDPLIFVFVILVGGPAIIPATFGYFMFKGREWAAWGLRISILATLIIGGYLDVFGNLDVFSFPMLSIPLILGCIIWLVGSFK